MFHERRNQDFFFFFFLTDNQSLIIDMLNLDIFFWKGEEQKYVQL